MSYRGTAREIEDIRKALLGKPRLIIGEDPAPGQEITVTVPAGKRWRLMAIRIVLTTSATVANRNVRLLFDDGANEIIRIGSTYVHPASVTNVYSYYPGLGQKQYNYDGLSEISLPIGLLLAPGFRIRTSTVNLQADDNFSAPHLYVEEFEDVQI